MGSDNNRPLVLILFGPPGSGKGTQAKLLTERLRVPHVSSGDILRWHILQEDELGLEVKATLLSGRLVSDEIANRLVNERTAQPDCTRGFLLDGYPRTTGQAAWLVDALTGRGAREVLIHLKVDYNELIARLTGRRHCPLCGAVYNLASNPPKQDGICDKDSGPLLWREDDRADVIEARLREYERQTSPVLEVLSRCGMARLDLEAGSGQPAEIAHQILQWVDCA